MASANDRRATLDPVQSSPPSSTTLHASDRRPARRFNRWYRVALSSFTGLCLLHLWRGSVHANADPAVHGGNLDRRAAAVHFALDPPPRLVAVGLELQAGH